MGPTLDTLEAADQNVIWHVLSGRSKSDYRRKLDAIDLLKKSLLHRVFSGQP